MANYVPQ